MNEPQIENETAPYDLMVIGAGAAGIAAALSAQRAGKRVLLLDAKDHVGGVIETIHEVSGLHECGANSTLIRDREVWELLEWSGAAEAAINPSPGAKSRYIRTVSGLKKLGPGAVFGSLFNPLDLLRLLSEPLRVRRPAPDSVADFIRQRLGNNFYRHAFFPMLAGIYAGDPEKLSWRHALPRLYERAGEGSLLFGLLKKRRGFKARLISGRAGMQPLMETMAYKLAPGAVRLCHKVETLRGHAGEYVAEGTRAVGRFKLTANSVVCAVEAGALAPLLTPLTRAVEPFIDLPYAPIALVHLRYRAEDCALPEGLGYLSAAGAPAGSLGTLFNSRMFPNRAPDGQHALTVFLGGAMRAEYMTWDDKLLIEMATQEHSRLGLLKADAKPVYADTTKVTRAIPQYNLGHEKYIAAAEAVEKSLPGLRLAGSYLTGAGVGDSMMSGVRAAMDLCKGE